MSVVLRVRITRELEIGRRQIDQSDTVQCVAISSKFGSSSVLIWFPAEQKQRGSNSLAPGRNTTTLDLVALLEKE